MRYGGVRLRGEARLGRTVYGAPFGLDVVFGHEIFGSHDVLSSRALLDFLGLEPTPVRVINCEIRNVQEDYLAATVVRRYHPDRILSTGPSPLTPS